MMSQDFQLGVFSMGSYDPKLTCFLFLVIEILKVHLHLLKKRPNYDFRHVEVALQLFNYRFPSRFRFQSLDSVLFHQTLPMVSGLVYHAEGHI